MTSPPSPPSRRRRRIVVTIAVLLLIVGWSLSSSRSRITSAQFWGYLEQHPTLASCVEPFYVVAGRQKEFTAKLLMAATFRRAQERSAQRMKQFLEMLKQVEDNHRPSVRFKTDPDAAR